VAHRPSNGDWIGFGTQSVVAVLSLVGGVGMLRLSQWAWVVAMLLQGYALTLYLWAYFTGRPHYLEMLIAAVIVFYLNTRPVRSVFEGVRRNASRDAAPSIASAGALDRSPPTGPRDQSAPDITRAPGVS
jgi:hypothetical protein